MHAFCLVLRARLDAVKLLLRLSCLIYWTATEQGKVPSLVVIMVLVQGFQKVNCNYPYILSRVSLNALRFRACCSSPEGCCTDQEHAAHGMGCHGGRAGHDPAGLKPALLTCSTSFNTPKWSTDLGLLSYLFCSFTSRLSVFAYM